MQDDNTATRTGSDRPSRCGHCDSKLAADEWYPTTSVTREDEVERVLVFCDEACQSAWEDGTGER